MMMKLVPSSAFLIAFGWIFVVSTIHIVNGGSSQQKRPTAAATALKATREVNQHYAQERQTSAYASGPLMKNSVSGDCSTEYGTVEWAIEKCDKDPNCLFIHDYGCDDKNWRYCTNLLIDEDNQGEACSRLKSGVGCIPYSEQACRDAALEEGFQLGGGGSDFIGDYVTKGCYAYRKKRTCERYEDFFLVGSICRKWRQEEETRGRAYYSTGGSLESMQEQANGGFDQIRPAGYDCGVERPLVNPFSG